MNLSNYKKMQFLLRHLFLEELKNVSIWMLYLRTPSFINFDTIQALLLPRVRGVILILTPHGRREANVVGSSAT